MKFSRILYLLRRTLFLIYLGDFLFVFLALSLFFDFISVGGKNTQFADKAKF